ncbi:MAG: glycosyltransferase family 4 protein [Vicinamibacterales bacterium]
MLFIGPLPEPVTGQSLACRVLLDGLPAGYRVELVDMAKREFTQGVSSLSRVAQVARILWRVWRRRRHADVVYLNVSESVAGSAKDLVIYALCFGKLGRTAIHLHGGAGMREIMRHRGPLRTLNAFFLKRLGAAIVLGESQREIYRGVVPEDRIHVVPNFAEDSLFTTTAGVDAKFDRTTPLRVLFLSNLLPGKGYEELADAYLGLDESVKASIRLDLAGAFEAEGARADFLAKVAGDRRIQYHGTVAGDRKRELFWQAHVFCLPTYYAYEGQPISILEAYASGCAVITTAHSGIPDVFRDGVNGLQVAARSVDALRAALTAAVSAPDALRQMAMTNHTTALDVYRTATFQRAVMGVLDRVANQ